MARDGEIDLSYVPTAELLANWFTKPLLKLALFRQCVAMGMIGIGLRNGIGNGLGTLRNCLGNGIRTGNGIGSGNGIWNAVGK
jgi:hypothetical protein